MTTHLTRAEPAISGQRLLDEIAELATFGGRADGGVDRVAGSRADLASRAWLTDRITKAGLLASGDEVGNVFGRTAASTGPWLLSGSHTDTVPAGGRLDGAYGVLAALEVLRTLHQAGHPAADLLRIVSFWDEEGAQPTASGGRVGSTAFSRSAETEHTCGFVELHIEQGPRMVHAGLEVATVTGIVGIDRYAITMRGVANHAGTTPMTGRADAGRAAARLAVGVWDIVDDGAPSMVGNIGCIDVWPGAPNVIPGEARIVVEFRDSSAEGLTTAGARLDQLAREFAEAEGCEAKLEQLSHAPVSAFDPVLCDLLDGVCRRTGRPTDRLFSYAGHDASPISRVVPTAMLFVPSTGGVSHSPAEHTPDPLLVQGCQALLNAIVAHHQHRTPT